MRKTSNIISEEQKEVENNIAKYEKEIREARAEIYKLEISKPNRWGCRYNQNYLQLTFFDSSASTQGGSLKFIVNDAHDRPKSVYLSTEKAHNLAIKILEMIYPAVSINNGVYDQWSLEKLKQQMLYAQADVCRWEAKFKKKKIKGETILMPNIKDRKEMHDRYISLKKAYLQKIKGHQKNKIWD
jgi:hypothetical protein